MENPAARADGQEPHRPTPVAIAWMAAACALVALTLGRTEAERVSFRAFYDDALSWRLGVDIITDPAVLPNLNPPLVAVLLSPITVVPLKHAFWIWSALGICSIAAGVYAIWRAKAVPKPRFPWMLGALGASVPGLIAWEDGQVTWLLFYPVTQAWLASRNSSFRAGVWLAPAIAVKPPLALMAMLLPWGTTLPAGIGSLALTIAAVAVTGWGPWAEWLLLSRQVTWLEWPLSASLWSTAARIQTGQVTGSSLTDLFWYWWIVIPLVAALLVLSVLRTSGERRWVLAFFWSILASPLGQVYYLPLVAGPIAASWPVNKAALVALTMLCVPLPLWGRLAYSDPLGTVLAASAYFIAVIVGWMAWCQAPHAAGRGKVLGPLSG